MEIYMSVTGERFSRFIRKKRKKMRDATKEGEPYYDTQFAEYLNIPYKTVKRWLKQKSVDRIDIENFLALLRKYGQEFVDALEQGEG